MLFVLPVITASIILMFQYLSLSGVSECVKRGQLGLGGGMHSAERHFSCTLKILWISNCYSDEFSNLMTSLGFWDIVIYS